MEPAEAQITKWELSLGYFAVIDVEDRTFTIGLPAPFALILTMPEGVQFNIGDSVLLKMEIPCQALKTTNPETSPSSSS